MLKIRRANERGLTQNNWLKSHHTFSFDHYYDPAFHNFHTLRVINHDFVAPGQGFAMHSHRDMEIITYVLTGAVAHKDSMGNKTIIRPGEIQRMSAGTGITHSEYNASSKEQLEFLQIWILPKEKNLAPDYGQMAFSKTYPQFRLLFSPDGENHSLTIQQHCKVWMGLFNAGQTLKYTITAGRSVWLQLIRGELKIDEDTFTAGDGLGITEQDDIWLSAITEAEFLLLDLA